MAISPTISSAPQFAAWNAAETIQSGIERLAFRKSFAPDRRRRESQPIRMVATRYRGRIAIPKLLSTGIYVASNFPHKILATHNHGAPQRVLERSTNC